MLTYEETMELEPLINPEILKGGALYYEYRTDDSRLTIEVIKKAAEYGAAVINYVEATDFIYHKRRLQGVVVKDVLSGAEHCIYAKYTVNATGVWVDQMRSKDNSLDNKRMHITKGIHIVVPRTKFPLRTAMYFDVGDKRMVFTIPRDRIVYIGTTDTEYYGSLENPTITHADIEYLVAAVKRIAPSVNLTINDVESAWSGLRPLIHKDGKAPSELSRKDEIEL
jgi:glycerol-3-phosphate dehydrogenase